MSVLETYQRNRRLREGRVWSLLAADKAPTYLALLESLFMEGESTLTASVFEARLQRELDYLQATDGSLERSAKALAQDWLGKGWLSRQLPPGATEEVFNLTSDAQQAIRFVQGLERPHMATTESRLATVMQQVVSLAQQTDPNLESRLAALEAERERIELQMARIRERGVEVLRPERALERIREVLVLAEALAVDFRQLREAFENLNREVRRGFLDPGGSRREQLAAAFNGIDVIAQSEAGRTFHAFWRLLTNSEQAAQLSAGLEAITSRDFSGQLDARERRFLRRLTTALMAEGSQVSTVMHQLAGGLRSFVKSREFREHQRMAGLLRSAQHAALQAQDAVKTSRSLDFNLRLSSADIDSVSRWQLEDPSLAIEAAPMTDAPPGKLDADTLRQLKEDDDIDFKALRRNIRRALAVHSQVSVAQMLDLYPVTQGLGTIVGYMSLAAQCGVTVDGVDTVEWAGPQGQKFRGTIPVQYFLQERLHELAD